MAGGSWRTSRGLWHRYTSIKKRDYCLEIITRLGLLLVGIYGVVNGEVSNACQRMSRSYP